MSNVMTPINFYLIDAAIKWIVDNGCTPFMSVDATHPRAQVPTDFVKDGRITLNISVNSVKNFHMDNEGISFEAGFNGRPTTVFVPTGAIIGVFAQETGQGMPMPPMPEAFDQAPEEPKETEEKPKKASFLKVVK